MKYILLLCTFYYAPAYGQADPMDPYKNEDPSKMEINNGITRMMMAFSTDLYLSFSLSYEHVLVKPFTLQIKAGPAFKTESERFAAKAFADAEIRYYFNLHRRTRLERTVKNFSGGYLGIEQIAVTPSAYIIKSDTNEDTPGYFGSYINIGFQKQVGKHYFSAFFGTLFSGKKFSNSVDVTDVLHAGFTLGLVF